MNIIDLFGLYEEKPGGANPITLGSQQSMNPPQQVTQQVPQQGIMGYTAGRDPNSLATYGVAPDTGPAPPVMPEYDETPDPFKPGDPSAMAAYGMETPALADPMSQLKMMISMAAPPKQQVQAPQGGLMSYLAQLGVV